MKQVQRGELKARDGAGPGRGRIAPFPMVPEGAPVGIAHSLPPLVRRRHMTASDFCGLYDDLGLPAAG